MLKVLSFFGNSFDADKGVLLTNFKPENGSVGVRHQAEHCQLKNDHKMLRNYLKD